MIPTKSFRYSLAKCSNLNASLVNLHDFARNLALGEPIFYLEYLQCSSFDNNSHNYIENPHDELLKVNIL